MNRLRTTPFLTAVLTVLAVPILTTATPVAQSAPLVDIRTTPPRDDFNRANESPIGSSNGAWAQADAGTWPAPARLINQQFAPASGLGSTTSVAYWTAQTLSGNLEVWATARDAADISEG